MKPYKVITQEFRIYEAVYWWSFEISIRILDLLSHNDLTIRTVTVFDFFESMNFLQFFIFLCSVTKKRMTIVQLILTENCNHLDC